MPQSLQEELNRLFSTTSRATHYQPGKPKLPPQIQGLPRSQQLERERAFHETAMQEKIKGEPPQLWEYPFQALKSTGEFLLDTLLAPGYAVSSAVRHLAREEDEIVVSDPFTAFVQGLTAGYRDDAEFETTMYDVLTEVGMNPESTWGSIGKHGLGFALDIVTDPITWLGPGAVAKTGGKLGWKISPKAFARASKENPILKVRNSVAEAFSTRSQRVSKAGQNVYNAMRKITNDAAKGTKADDMARRWFIRTGLPTEQAAKISEPLKMVTIGGKKHSGIEVALKALGKKVTPATKEWFEKDGWKQLFQTGGWHINVPFGPRIMLKASKTGIIGPHTSSYFGAMFGNLFRHNIEWVAGAERAVKWANHPGHKLLPKAVNEIWARTMGKQIGGLSKILTKSFNSMAGMTTPLKATIRSMRGAIGAAQHQARQVINSQLMKETGEYVSKKEQRLLARMSWDASSKFNIESDKVAAWIQRELTNPTQPETKVYLQQLNMPEKLSEEYAKEIASVANKITPGLQALAEQDAKRGIAYPKLASYFPYEPGVKLKKFGAEAGQAGMRRRMGFSLDFADYRYTQGKSWHELQSMDLKYDSGLAAKPSDDLEKILMRRYTNSYRYAVSQDILQQHGDEVIRHGIAAGGEDAQKYDRQIRKWLIKEKKFVNDHPLLAYWLAEIGNQVSAGVEREGGKVPKLKSFFGDLDRIPANLDPETAGKRVNKAVGKLLQSLEGPYNDAVRDRVLRDIDSWANRTDMFSDYARHGAEFGDKSLVSEALRGQKDRIKDFFNDQRIEVELNKVLSARKEYAEEAQKIVGEAKDAFADPDKLKALERDAKKALKKAETAEDLVKNYPKWEAAARKLGGKELEEYMPKLVRAIGGNKPLEEFGEHEVKALKEVFEHNRPAEWAKRLLSQEERMVSARSIEHIKIKSPLNPKKLVSAGRFSVAVPVARELNRLYNPVQLLKNQGGPLLKMWDEATGWLKYMLTGAVVPGVPRPNFFGRNQGDIFFRRALSIFSGIGRQTVDTTKMTVDTLMGRSKDLFTTPFGTTETTQTIGEWFKLSGLQHFWGNRGFARWRGAVDEYMQYVLEHEGKEIVVPGGFRRKAYDLLPDKMKKQLATQYQARKVMKTPERLGAFQENMGLLEAGITGLKNGIPKSDVEDILARHLYDYNNLTDFERKISRFVLFYNFKRQSAPLIWQTLVENPQFISGFTRIPKMATNTKEEEALLPSWVKDFPFVNIRGEPKKFKIMSFRNMFTYDLIGEMMPSNLNAVLGQLNPLMTVLPELALGKTLYLKRPIKSRRYLERDTSMYALQMPGFKQLLNPKRVKLANGQDYIAVNGPEYHAIQNTWFSRFFRELDQIGRTIKDFNTWEAFGRFAFGVKIYEYEKTKQQYWLNMATTKLKAEYDKALRRGDKAYAIELLDRMSNR